MKLYKDSNNLVYFYPDDGSQDDSIGDKIQITHIEANALMEEQQQALIRALPLTYAQKRAAEYPPFTDYLDGIVKGDQGQIQTYIDACLAVKAKYPKS
jgi:hypothetical protein